MKKIVFSVFLCIEAFLLAFNSPVKAQSKGKYHYETSFMTDAGSISEHIPLQPLDVFTDLLLKKGDVMVKADMGEDFIQPAGTFTVTVNFVVSLIEDGITPTT